MPHYVNPIELRREQAATALERWVPRRYRAATADHPDVVTWVRHVIDGGRNSLLLVGNVGTGKTWQAYGALTAVVNGRAESGHPTSIAAITHAGLNDEVRPGGAGLDPYMGVDVLVLDDLGAAHVTAWNADAAYRLVDHRWANELVTVFTSNVSAADLTATLGPRLSSRLAGMTHRVVIDGPDRRWAA